MSASFGIPPCSPSQYSAPLGLGSFLFSAISFNQSTEQAFYFIKDINTKDIPITENDWIVAYYNNLVVGARQWFGEYTDVPVMGDDGFIETSGYCDNNSSVEFKIYRPITAEYIALEGTIPKWKNLKNFIVDSLSEEHIIPSNYKLYDPYPNPFNPVVNIDFDVSQKGNIELSIYDLRGRLVEKIINNQIYEAGSYNIKWLAENYASGIYLVKFYAEDKQSIKKMTLLK